jgi:hypothetical protein
MSFVENGNEYAFFETVHKISDVLLSESVGLKWLKLPKTICFAFSTIYGIISINSVEFELTDGLV